MDGSLTSVEGRDELGVTTLRDDAVEGLDAFFRPRVIAVVGASDQEGKLGTSVMRALVEGPFAGEVLPVNRKGGQILGRDVTVDLAEVIARPDLVFVCVADKVVPAVLEECVRQGIPGVVVLTASLGLDAAAEAELLARLRAAGCRLVGPNCMGVHSTQSGVSWTHRANFTAGSIGVVSHSGGISQDLLLAATARGLGLHSVASLGNCADVDEVDVLEHFAAQEGLSAIGMYVEGSTRAPALLDAIERVSPTIPVVCMKGGRGAGSAEAVATHTGRIAGDYRIWSSLLQNAGAHVVDTPEELLNTAMVLDHGFVSGPLIFVGNGGGASVLIADLLEAVGLELARVSEPDVTRLEGRVGVPASNGGALWDIPLNIMVANDGGALLDLIASLLGDNPRARLVLHLNLTSFANQRDAAHAVRALVAPIGSAGWGSRLILVLRSDGSPEVDELRRVAMGELSGSDPLPCFVSIEALVRALAVVAEQRRLQGVDPA